MVWCANLRCIRCAKESRSCPPREGAGAGGWLEEAGGWLEEAGGWLEEALLPPDGKRAVVGDGVAVQLDEDVAWQLIRR